MTMTKEYSEQEFKKPPQPSKLIRMYKFFLVSMQVCFSLLIFAVIILGLVYLLKLLITKVF